MRKFQDLFLYKILKIRFELKSTRQIGINFIHLRIFFPVIKKIYERYRKTIFHNFNKMLFFLNLFKIKYKKNIIIKPLAPLRT